MPHYSFELHIVLAKFGEQPVHMSKRILDLYATQTVELAYYMAKSYIETGWRIERVECINYEFLSDISLTWGD